MAHQIIEYSVPENVSLETVRNDIKSRFPYHSETTARIKRSYQDSFDCRLYKGGYEYFVEQYKDQSFLFLYQTNSINKIHVLSVHEIPVFAKDFKSVIFHRLISPILDVRALMSHVVLNIKRQIMIMVNDENKIYAQIQIDEARLQSPQRKHKYLGKMLRVLPLKGYESFADPILHHLETKLGFERLHETILRSALERTETGYCPLMAFPHHALREDMRTDEAIKAILLSELEIMELNESGLTQNIDTEFLHDYRVAIRRTRSVLKQIKGVFHKKIIDRYNSVFSNLGKLTGPLRDIHVYLLNFDNYQQQLPEDLKSDLEPFRVFLLKHEKIEHIKLLNMLTKKRYLNFKSSWREFLEEPLPEKVNLANANRLIKQVSDMAIWNAFQKVVTYGVKIKDESPDEKLHRMRINCKKLRYLLEFFRDLYPKSKMATILKSLKKLQNVLGNFQDLSVQANTIRVFESQMKEEDMLTEETLTAMEFLVSHIEKSKKEIRLKYMESYHNLTGSKLETLFSKLFHTESQVS